jgi:hypothetical protein
VTRGKHAAQANRRRATEADAEIERWREEAARWKKLASKYIHDAQRVEPLERLLRKARGEVSVPEYQHEHELAKLEERWAERWEQTMDAVVVIIRQLMKHIDPDGEYLSSRFLTAMRTLPEDVAREATQDKWNRDEFRAFTAPGVAHKVNDLNRKPITAAAMSLGYVNGQIPAEALDGELHARVQRLINQDGKTQHSEVVQRGKEWLSE